MASIFLAAANGSHHELGPAGSGSSRGMAVASGDHPVGCGDVSGKIGPREDRPQVAAAVSAVRRGVASAEW